MAFLAGPGWRLLGGRGFSRSVAARHGYLFRSPGTNYRRKKTATRDPEGLQSPLL